MTDVISQPWLSVIGIGEDGCDGLSALALHLIKECTVLIGGQRHLDMIDDAVAPDAERRVWPSPFSTAIDAIRALEGQSVVVLASGDPMYFGIGGTLSRFF